MRLRFCIAVAVTPIQPLAWEPPHAVSVALKSKKKKKIDHTKKGSTQSSVFKPTSLRVGLHTRAQALLP